jgi:regulatory protein
MKPKSTPDSATLRERALALLARREHSRHELTRKLETAGFARDVIEPLLDTLVAKNWLSDQRFAESYVADHQARAGCVKLAHDLRQRGVADFLIETVLAKSQDSEIERARAIWQKKFGMPPVNVHDKARQIRFLQGRGFSHKVIQSAMCESQRTKNCF